MDDLGFHQEHIHVSHAWAHIVQYSKAMPNKFLVSHPHPLL